MVICDFGPVPYIIRIDTMFSLYLKVLTVPDDCRIVAFMGEVAAGLN